MATLTSQIQALIAYANEITGKEDTQLGDAVKSLADGYGGGVRLPEEYQEVEYLESTGTQWIDTGIFGKHNSIIFLDMQLRKQPTGYTLIMGWSDNSSSWNPFTIACMGASIVTFGRISILGNNDVPFERRLLTFISSLTEPTNGTIGLFKTKGFVGAYANQPFACYRITIKEVNNTVFDAVPCYRKADNVAGMYDYVSGQFLTNQGAGEFIVGPDVN